MSASERLQEKEYCDSRDIGFGAALAVVCFERSFDSVPENLAECHHKMLSARKKEYSDEEWRLAENRTRELADELLKVMWRHAGSGEWLARGIRKRCEE